MLILRIRQAECALGDGRLDEAFELADRHDVRSHRRGQRLVGRLVKALVDRGRKHLDGGRLHDASADSEKARRLGGLMPDVAGLRSAIAERMSEKVRVERNQARLVAAARQHIDNGQLSVGGKLLEGLGESRAGVMLRDVEARRATIDGAVVAAEAALKRDDWESAVRELAKVRSSDGAATPAVAGLVAKVGQLVRQRVQASLNDGDVRLAGAMLQRLMLVDGQCVETERLRHVVAQCRTAWDCIDKCEPRRAEEIVRRLATLLPKASWPNHVVKQLRQAAELIDELRAGPLGLLAGSGVMEPKAVDDARLAKTPSPARLVADSPGADPSSALPSRFVLQVDGAGSYLILTQPLITLGPLSASRIPDVGLMADANAAVATIERVEEDYFLRASSHVLVNGRPSSGKLLTTGDDVGLSPRCRFTFRLPSAASTSAVIDLTGTRYPRADVRRVILLDRELVIGPGAGAHVRVDDLAEKVVLHVRDGRLFVQTAQAVLLGDREIAPKMPVALGTHVKAGPVSFVVTRA